MPPRLQSTLLNLEVLEDLYVHQGLSLMEVARRTGTNTRFVRDSLHAVGLRPRTKSEAAIGKPKPSSMGEKIRLFRTGKKDSEATRQKKALILEGAGGRGWNRGLTAQIDERVARQRNASVKAMGSVEFRERSSESAVVRLRSMNLHPDSEFASRGKYRKGYYQSKAGTASFYMSGWELRRFQELDSDPSVESWEAQPCSISYFWSGATKQYLPDLLVRYLDGRVILEEIKPKVMVDRALSGDPVYARLRAKIESGAAFAKSRGWGWRIVYFPEKVGPSCIFF